MIIDEFSKFQIEWLTNHCDIEFNKEDEDLIIRFLKDTAELYQRENECEDCISRAEVLHILECNKHVYVEDIEEPDCKYYHAEQGGRCFAQKCAPACTCGGIEERCDR